MNLSEYIETVGVPKVCELTGVTKATAYNWKTAKSIPTPEHAFNLILESNGVLSWESVYQPYFDED